MIVLALDLATRTGWARGVPGEEPTYGSIRWGGGDGASVEAILGEFGKWFIKQTEADCIPDVVAYEAPIYAHFGKTNAKATEILQGLAGGVKMLSYIRGIHNQRLQSVHVNTWRGYFLGRDRLETNEAKRLCIRKCKLLRWEPEDDNAADALGLWSYQCARLVPSTSLKVTPLFSRVR